MVENKMKWHPYKNIDPFRIPEIADKLLDECLEITKKLGIVAFLWEGTCLGFIRDCGYIEADNDIDIGVKVNVAGLERLTTELIKNGFERKNEWWGNRHFLKYGILLDITYGFLGQYHHYLKGFDIVTYKNKEYPIPQDVEAFFREKYGDWKIIRHRKVWEG